MNSDEEFAEFFTAGKKYTKNEIKKLQASFEKENLSLANEVESLRSDIYKNVLVLCKLDKKDQSAIFSFIKEIKVLISELKEKDKKFLANLKNHEYSSAVTEIYVDLAAKA